MKTNVSRSSWACSFRNAAQAFATQQPGPGRAIGAVPFVGPNGKAYAAWNDFSKANNITFNRSFDGGVTWGTPTVIAAKTVPCEILVPAESFRGALIYPACDAERSSGPHRGRLYCSWMDLTAAGVADIFLPFSDDRGATWSAPKAATDPMPFPVDRFNHWLSVDPAAGAVNLSFYDTRNDTTGFRFQTDVFFTQSTDGGCNVPLAESERDLGELKRTRLQRPISLPGDPTATSTATTKGWFPLEERLIPFGPTAATSSCLLPAASPTC